MTARQADNEPWLAQVQEAPLEPDVVICDAHHHLWDRREGRIQRRYMIDEIMADIASGHTIVSTVFIEHLSFFRAEGPDAMKYVGEVEFANGMAAMAASGLYGKTHVSAGIIGYADMRMGARVREVLEAELRAAPDRLKGIRCTGAWDPDPRIARVDRPGLYSDATFREGIAQCAPLGLSFDVTARLTQLPEVADMARQLPGTTFILNHIGGVPGIGAYAGRRDDIFARWSRSIRALAGCPNVFVKLGGLGMRINGFDFEKAERPPSSEALATAWRPYLETCIEAFGVERCMFESNFPVDKGSYAYGVGWNAFKRLTKGASADEKTALFSATATQFYRLNESP